jgi:hypothetical protein
MFHAFVKRPLVGLLPDAIQRRLSNHLGEFHFGGTARFALIVSSILLGIATHLAWDSFTHPNTWPYSHWRILSQPVPMPIIGPIPFFKVLQHGSTILGVGVFSVWLVLRYCSSQPSGQGLSNVALPKKKMRVVAVVTIVALAGAFIRALAVVGVPTEHSSERRFVGVMVVAAIALAWWQLVAFGVVSSRKRNISRTHSP